MTCQTVPGLVYSQKQKQMKEQLLFYLKRCIKHNQFGASGHQIVTAVGLHKPCVHIVLWV